MSSRLRIVTGVLVAISALGLWLVALVATLHRQAPTWVLFVLAPALLLSVFSYARWHARRSRVETDEADELSPWRELRVIRSLVLRTESPKECTLVLELAREADPTTTAATLRFGGVVGIRMLQFAEYPLAFDGLRSSRFRRGRDGETWLRVVDSRNGMLQFVCRSFEQLHPDGRAAPAR